VLVPGVPEDAQFLEPAADVRAGPAVLRRQAVAEGPVREAQREGVDDLRGAEAPLSRKASASGLCFKVSW